MTSLYDLLATALAAAAVPVLFLRAAGDPQGRRGLPERFGRLPDWPGDPGLWIQAVSVGEVGQARHFIRALRAEGPPLPVALSATTRAGRLRAEEAGADLRFTFPLDAPWIVRRALDRLAPRAFGMVETEIWPGLLSSCARRGIPAFMVNGSISERSFSRWQWLARPVREGLGALRAACMQTAADAERISRLGAPERAVIVTGNMKFDAPVAGAGDVARLRSLLGIPPEAAVFVAGSTSEGEEEIVARAWIAAREAVPGLRLVVAPRHPARFDGAARALEAVAGPILRRSRMEPADHGPGRAVLLDTLGELNAAYALASAAFVGGSLVPRGGQNPLEPARLGVPVLFGPGMGGFRDIAAGLLACGGAREVSGTEDLARALSALLRDPEGRRRSGEAARTYVAAHQGATERTLRALRERIPEVFT